MAMLSLCIAATSAFAPMASRPTLMQAARTSVPIMAGGVKKINSFDDTGNGVFEVREVSYDKPPVALLSRVEELRWATAVSELGLLSAAEEAGVFSKLESAGAFSKIEALLPTIENLQVRARLRAASIAAILVARSDPRASYHNRCFLFSRTPSRSRQVRLHTFIGITDDHLAIISPPLPPGPIVSSLPSDCSHPGWQASFSPPRTSSSSSAPLSTCFRSAASCPCRTASSLPSRRLSSLLAPWPASRFCSRRPCWSASCRRGLSRISRRCSKRAPHVLPVQVGRPA